MRGIVPFAYAAFALTLGVAAGLLLRRPIAATALLAAFCFWRVRRGTP